MRSHALVQDNGRLRGVVKRRFFPLRHWRLMWFLVFLGSLNFSLRGATAIYDTPLIPEVIHRPISIALVSLPLLLYLLRSFSVVIRGIFSFMVLYSLWLIASALWSPFPLWTLYRSVEYLVVVLLTACTVASFGKLGQVRDWLNWVWTWFAILMASTYLGLILFPEDALVPVPSGVLPVMLTGVVPRVNPTSLGQFGGILALVGFARWFGEERPKHSPVPKKWLFLVAWGLTTMVIAQGRAAMVGFMAGSIIISVCYRRIAVLYGMAIALGFYVLLFQNPWEPFWEFFRRGQSESVFFSLSTRLDWWYEVWDSLIKESLFVGYGAYAGGRLVAPIALSKLHRVTIDSTWLELVIDTGIVGLVLFVVPLIWACKILLSTARRAKGLARVVSVECLAVLTLALVRSLFTSGLIFHSAFFYFAAIGCAEFLRRHRVEVSS